MTDANRPNIVFMVADNVGWGDLSCFGGLVPTPRLDQLADEGIRFTNFNTEAQCTPTRSAILTGRMPVRSGTLADRTRYRIHDFAARLFAAVRVRRSHPKPFSPRDLL